mmetsp:Transcript_39860/g.59126  ORF Transcript_39860/g.59126 Transcript_39860/m.59126 type:complete len:95 (+) Transcript_39860:1343-1627(+)
MWIMLSVANVPNPSSHNVALPPEPIETFDRCLTELRRSRRRLKDVASRRPIELACNKEGCKLEKSWVFLVAWTWPFVHHDRKVEGCPHGSCRGC